MPSVRIPVRANRRGFRVDRNARNSRRLAMGTGSKEAKKLNISLAVDICKKQHHERQTQTCPKVSQMAQARAQANLGVIVAEAVKLAETRAAKTAPGQRLGRPKVHTDRAQPIVENGCAAIGQPRRLRRRPRPLKTPRKSSTGPTMKIANFACNRLAAHGTRDRLRRVLWGTSVRLQPPPARAPVGPCAGPLLLTGDQVEPIRRMAA